MGRILIFITFLLTTAFLIGCQTNKQAEVSTEANAATIQETSSTTHPAHLYLNPGDEIELQFFYTPELNTRQIIRPDGRISLQLVGEVEVTSKTPSQLKEELFNLYSKHLRQLDINIIVHTLEARRIYVMGEVNAPGIILMPSNVTLFEAIMSAGGVDLVSGSYADVLILRNIDGEWTGGKFDLAKVMQGETAEALYLQPQDIVYVPETRITNVNRWIEQHIGTVLPEIGISYVVTPGAPNVIGITGTYAPGRDDED